MPIVPVEENKVGLADLSDAKLRPADYSGSGLEALGAGLAGLGKAGSEFAARLPRPSAAEATHARLLRTDLAAKQAWNDGHEANTALLDDFRQLTGKDARDALAPVAEAMAQNLHAVRHGHDDEHVRAIIDGTLAHRTARDIVDLHAHADAQDAIAQARESQRLIDNSASDALRHVTDPTRFDDAIATGENTLRRQGQLAGKGEGEIAHDVAAWQSRRYVDAVHALAPSDGLGATALFERYRDQLTPADRAALEPLLHEPMAQTQAIADIDTAALAAAPFAPLTPQGDPLLADRIRTITPHFDRVVLPELMQRYGGDAARAWAATQIGTDAVDDLVKQRGDGWYQALPEAARHAVAHNFALLNAGSSARTAPQDRAAVEASLAGLDDTRRGYAQRELTLRTSRADQARRAAQGAAADQAYALADQLGHDFTSLAQLPAKVRADLSDQTSAALQRQADANIDPHPVAPEGAASLALRNMATTAPEAFREIDMREYRDLVSPQEYNLFQRVQRGYLLDQGASEFARATQPPATAQPRRNNLQAEDNNDPIQGSPNEDWHVASASEGAHDFLDPHLLDSLKAQADIETQRPAGARGAQPLRGGVVGQTRPRKPNRAQRDDRIFRGSRYDGLSPADREIMLAATMREEQDIMRAAEARANAAAQALKVADPPRKPAKPGSFSPGHPVVLPDGKGLIDVDPYWNSRFLMSPNPDLRPVAAEGRAAGRNFQNMMESPILSDKAYTFLFQSIAFNLAQGGRFDYQRSGNHISGFKQLRQFRNVSNFNVGLFMQQTGLFSLSETLRISGNFARLLSNNSRPDRPYNLDDQTAKWIRIGYGAGRSGQFGQATKGTYKPF